MIMKIITKNNDNANNFWKGAQLGINWFDCDISIAALSWSEVKFKQNPGIGKVSSCMPVLWPFEWTGQLKRKKRFCRDKDLYRRKSEVIKSIECSTYPSKICRVVVSNTLLKFSWDSICPIARHLYILSPAEHWPSSSYNGSTIIAESVSLLSSYSHLPAWVFLVTTEHSKHCDDVFHSTSFSDILE